MELYGVALVPLAEKMMVAIPDNLQPWYADDVSGAGNAVDNAECMLFLKENGPTYGYFPEPEKSLHICKMEDEAAVKVAFYSQGLKVKFVRGARYLGGYIGGKVHRNKWVDAKVAKWADQTAFAGLTISLQNEWQYLSRTVLDIGHRFEPVERAIRQRLLPELMGLESISGEMRQLMAQGVKQAGLGIRKPVESAAELFATSKAACSELTSSILGRDEVNLAQHRASV